MQLFNETEKKSVVRRRLGRLFGSIPGGYPPLLSVEGPGDDERAKLLLIHKNCEVLLRVVD